MSKKKRTRTARRAGGAPTETHRRSWRRRWLNGPSLIFLALIAVIAAAALVSAMMQDDGGVECPAGQVWSDAHGHCH